jgi:zinc and cadmium transporter
MPVLSSIIVANLFISLLGLAGVFTLAMSPKALKSSLILLVSLAAGTLLGGAFFHLLPEALEELETTSVFAITTGAFILFFLIEKILHWRHCHSETCKVHSFGYLNLFGDSIHNFLDGVIIAAAFLTSPALGVSTTLAIALHELPQEIGDFGVLVHSGFSRPKALLANVAVAAMALLGGILGYFFLKFGDGSIPYFLPLAAGGFLYIATSDLIPEIRKETNVGKSILSLTIFILGLVIMYVTSVFE